MYRAVEPEEADRDLHRFLWRADPKSPLTDYRMTQVTFASPFLAVKALQQTALDFGDDYPLAKQSFHVDDLLAGAETTEDAITLQSSGIYCYKEDLTSANGGVALNIFCNRSSQNY